MKEFDSEDIDVLGVYISSFHVTKAIVNLQTRTIEQSSYERKPINSRGSAHEIIATCCTEIGKGLGERHKVNKIGIAMPGPFDYDQGISQIKNTKKYDAIYGLNFKEQVAEQLNLPVKHICMKNDAACFLQGEVFAGVARGYKRAIGLIMGTGLGTAKFSELFAEDADLWQSPFLDSIAEDYISTRWFLKRYYELSGLNTTSIAELAEFYPTSNTVKNIFKEFAHNLAIFINNFCKAAEPEVIVLGGDIGRASGCFLPALKLQLNKMENDIPVHISRLNDAAPIIGAATCWL